MVAAIPEEGAGGGQTNTDSFFGERAWEECNLDYVANMFKDEKRHRFLADVQRAISKKMDRDRKLDAALPTRLSPEPQVPKIITGRGM